MAYNLRHSTNPPMSWAEVGEKMKRDRRGVQRACERAERKMPHEGELLPPSRTSLEATDPVKYANFVAGIVDADGKVKNVDESAKRLGIPHETAQLIVKRLNTSHTAVRQEVRTVKRDYLKRRWGMVAADALDAITPEKLEKANVRDLGILGGIATDKLLVLQGLPSQIVRTEGDRAKLGDLAEALMLEMGRRGITVKMPQPSTISDVEYTRIESGSSDSGGE